MKNAVVAAEHEMWWGSVTRIASPSTITELPTHLVIDESTYVRCMIVGVPGIGDEGAEGYPRNMSPLVIKRLMDLGFEGCTISLSNTTIPINVMESQRLLQKTAFINQINQKSATEANPGNVPEIVLSLDMMDIQENAKRVHDNDVRMFHDAFIITIWAESLSILREVESYIESILDSERTLHEYPNYRMLKTFLASLPFPNTEDWAMVQAFSDHAATISTVQNPNSRTDNTGLYFGDDRDTGKNILIDLSSYPAQHMMLLGPTGSGKTFTLLMLLMRAHDLLNKRIIYTTPKADVGTAYRAVASYYGKNACIVDIGPTGSNINPLQILFDEKDMKSSWSYIRVYDGQKMLLTNFFKVWMDTGFTTNMASYLDRVITEVYDDAGIIRENPESWKNATWPVMLDLLHIFDRDRQDKSLGMERQTAEALYNRTHTVDQRGALSYVNNPTDVDLSADFIIIDLSGVPDYDSFQDAMNVLVTGLMGSRFKTDMKKETIIAVDEAAVFLRNPRLGLFLLRTLTQGRSFGISLWLATQQMADLAKANVEEEFMTNMFFKIILGGNMGKDTIKHVQEYFNLSSGSIESLLSAKVGEGVLTTQNEEFPVNFKPTQHEMDIIKGRYNSATESEVGAVFTVNHEDLVEQHKLIVEDWIEGDSTPLRNTGLLQKQIQRVTGRGNVNIWLPPTILKDGKVGNQSLDHYGTVVQLAAYLDECGFSEIQVNHYHEVDISCVFEDVKYAFEYERPKSHSKQELIKKMAAAEENHNKVVFVCTATNEKTVSSAVGEENTVRRGNQLVDYINRIVENSEKRSEEPIKELMTIIEKPDILSI